MTAGVLEQPQAVVGAPRVWGLGFGSRMRDTAAGRALQAREIHRLRAWCERTETPWFPCPRGTSGLKVETGEPVGATSGRAA
jgi:hypothetical protein